MRSISAAILMALCAVSAHAQYTTATVASVNTGSDGKIAVVLTFSGSGVDSRNIEFFPMSESDLSQKQLSTKAELNGKDSAGKAFKVGQVITDPVAPTPQTQPPLDAKQQWLSDLAACQQMAVRVAQVLNPDDVQDVIDCRKSVGDAYKAGFLK